MINFPEQLALTAQETLDETINCLTSHIPLNTKGAYDAHSLFQILVRAASQGDTIENTARELKNCPGGNNIRYHFSKINDFKELESQLNLALKSRIPKGLKKKDKL